MYLHPPEMLADLVPPDQPGYRADQLREWLYTTPVLTVVEWARNLQGLGVSIEDAFVEVCLQAWELR